MRLRIWSSRCRDEPSERSRRISHFNFAAFAAEIEDFGGRRPPLQKKGRPASRRRQPIEAIRCPVSGGPATSSFRTRPVLRRLIKGKREPGNDQLRGATYRRAGRHRVAFLSRGADSAKYQVDARDRGEFPGPVDS